MLAYEQSKEHQTFETSVLDRALDRDTDSIRIVLDYLGSSIPHLSQLMQETIHLSKDPRVWYCLHGFFASRSWYDIHWGRYNAGKTIETRRIDQSIIEIFTQDKYEGEKRSKESFLRDRLNDPEPVNRYSAAYLLGLRGEVSAIPMLEENIVLGPDEWKLRSVKALAIIKDERCGLPLLKALTMGRDRLHREARRALLGLGKLAEPVWIKALEHPDPHIRWEAARGLGNYGNSDAVDVLAEGLFDDDYAVRWATADVLARLGERAVPAVLRALSNHSINEQSRQAAYHALHGISSNRVLERIKPLLDALNRHSGNVPAIAQRLLFEWESNPENK
jgi:HEAT repeat protein